MSRLIFTNCEKYKNTLHKMNCKNDFCISGEKEAIGFVNYKKRNVDNYNYCSINDDFVASVGTVLYKEKCNEEAFQQMYMDYINKGIKYIRANLIGTYALVIKYGNKINIFVDETGNYALYYYCLGNNYLVTNLLYHICVATGTKVDTISLLEEMNEYCILDDKTYLTNTNRLLANQMISVDLISNEFAVVNVEVNTYSLKANSFDEVVKVLANTIKKYATLQKNISNRKRLFMTGGMDSRLTLASDLSIGYLPDLANWQGQPIFMNTKPEDGVISKTIADAVGLECEIIDISNDEPHTICIDDFERIGEYAIVYGNNIKWHNIFNDKEFDFYDFGYFGETVKEWDPLERYYHDSFSIDDFAELYLGRQKHIYTNLDEKFVSEYQNNIKKKLKKISLDQGFDTEDLSREDCMYLYYIYRTHADTKMVNFANIYGYSINLYAQKELIDYINQVPYDFKKEGKLNLALTENLYSELLYMPYFSHCHFVEFSKKKMLLQEPLKKRIKGRISRILPKRVKELIKSWFYIESKSKEQTEFVERFEIYNIDVAWLPRVNQDTYSDVGAYKTYYDYYTMLKDREIYE